MQRNTQIGVLASVLLHLVLLGGLSVWVTSSYFPATISVNRGFVSVTATLAVPNIEETAEEMHVHLPWVPQDHVHPDTLVAAHSHTRQDAPVGAVGAPFSSPSPSLAVTVAPLPRPTEFTHPASEPRTSARESQQATPLPRRQTHPVPRTVTTATIPAASSAAMDQGVAVDELPVPSPSNPPPPYPAEAYVERREGRVVLEVSVDARGRVTEIKVVQTSGYVPFDESALDTVRTWHFSPARRGSTPVPYTVRVPIRFAIRMS